MQLPLLTFSHTHTNRTEKSSCIHRPVGKHSESVSNEQLKNREAPLLMCALGFPLSQGIWQSSVTRSHRLSGLFPSHHTHSVSCRSYNHITLLTKASESRDRLSGIIPLMKNREWDGKMGNESETTNIEDKKKEREGWGCNESNLL